MLDIQRETRDILDRALGLGGRARGFTDDTRLLGVLPELDSMAVVGVLTALEERFGFVIGDDEIDGAAFATLGSLVDFIRRKVSV